MIFLVALNLLTQIIVVSSNIPPFHRFCGVRNDIGNCHHVRVPSFNDLLLSPHIADYDDSIGDRLDLSKFHQNSDHRASRQANLDNRHFLDMFLHENDHEAGVSPLDIPLDASYTHHPNRWEWNS